MTHYLEGTDEAARELARCAFPEYKGRKFSVKTVVDGEVDTSWNNYWSGGSRSYYALVELATGKAKRLPSSEPGFNEKEHRRQKHTPVPEGFCLVEYRISGSRYKAVVFYLRPENITKLIKEEKVNLSPEEHLLLSITKGLKSSYRLEEWVNYAHLPERLYKETKLALIDKGLLNKRGAITAKGRNTLESLGDLSPFKYTEMKQRMYPEKEAR